MVASDAQDIRNEAANPNLETVNPCQAIKFSSPGKDTVGLTKNSAQAIFDTRDSDNFDIIADVTSFLAHDVDAVHLCKLLHSGLDGLPSVVSPFSNDACKVISEDIQACDAFVNSTVTDTNDVMDHRSENGGLALCPVVSNETRVEVDTASQVQYHVLSGDHHNAYSPGTVLPGGASSFGTGDGGETVDSGSIPVVSGIVIYEKGIPLGRKRVVLVYITLRDFIKSAILKMTAILVSILAEAKRASASDYLAHIGGKMSSSGLLIGVGIVILVMLVCGALFLLFDDPSAEGNLLTCLVSVHIFLPLLHCIMKNRRENAEEVLHLNVQMTSQDGSDLR